MFDVSLKDKFWSSMFIWTFLFNFSLLLVFSQILVLINHYCFNKKLF